jgi:hypothetical protein
MISLQLLLPPRTPRSAFGNLVKDEFRWARRARTGPVVSLGLPLSLLVIYGSLPGSRQPGRTWVD